MTPPLLFILCFYVLFGRIYYHFADQLAHILENVDASILVVTPDEVDKAEIALSRCLGIQVGLHSFYTL